MRARSRGLIGAFTLPFSLHYAIGGPVAGDAPTMRGYVWWARLLGGLLPTLLIVGVAWRRYAPTHGSAAVIAAKTRCRRHTGHPA